MMKEKIIKSLFYILIAPVYALTLAFSFFKYPEMHGVLGMDYSYFKGLSNQVIFWGAIFTVYLFGNIFFLRWRNKGEMIKLGYDVFVIAFISLFNQIFFIYKFFNR